MLLKTKTQKDVVRPERFELPTFWFVQEGHGPRASRRFVSETPYLVGYCQWDGRSGRVVLAGQSHAASCRNHS